MTFVLNGSERRNPLKKTFLSKDVIFRGQRLSLGRFGQKVAESPVSHDVLTSSLPPFIVDLLAFKDYPRSNSFFNGNFSGC